jgi:hypothetical protein
LQEFQARQQDRRAPKHQPPTTDELRDMLRGLKWGYWGNERVQTIGGVKFACGIGIYLGRYTCAIAANARWVVLKPIPSTYKETINNLNVAKEATTGLAALLLYKPEVIRPTTLAKKGIEIDFIRSTRMYNEFVMPTFQFDDEA